LLRKTVSGIVLMLLLTSMLSSAFIIHPVKAAIITVPDDYSTIQKAINAANSGDTIYVKAGTYYEHVIVNKSLSLIGENKSTTIIDGYGNGTVVKVTADNVAIMSFTIQNGARGISLVYCTGAYLKDNEMTGNLYNFDIYALYNVRIEYFIHDIDTSNTVEGKPIYYWKNKKNMQIPSNAGYVAIVNSTKIDVQNLTLANNGQGLLLAYTSDSTIKNLKVYSTDLGVALYSSSANTIENNTIQDSNTYGAYLDHCSQNVLRNNVIATARWRGVGLRSSTGNVLRSNNITESGSGIWLAHSESNILHENILASNDYGISLHKSNVNTISNNSVSNNWDGITMMESCFNIVSNNSISNNVGSGISMYTCDNNQINGNDITGNRGAGIEMITSDGNVIRSNIMHNGSFGIVARSCGGNMIRGNVVSRNEYGILLSGSGGNTLRDNNMTDNLYDFNVFGDALSQFVNDVDPSNTVNGKPIYYLISQKDITIDPSTFPNIGYLALVNSVNITVRNSNIHGVLLAFTNLSIIENVNASNTFTGLDLTYSNDNVIRNTVVFNCRYGIRLRYSGRNDVHSSTATSNEINGISLLNSYNNTIAGNTFLGNGRRGIQLTAPGTTGNIIGYNNVINNDVGIGLYNCRKNKIYHNNFVDNAKQVDSEWESANTWDEGYPSGGNYWSDYAGVDNFSGPYQNVTGSDGIGDSPYVVDENNVDHYPLMGPFNSFNTSVGCSVDVISNSTVEDFRYFESNSTIIMHVSNMTANQTVGFCRLTIPHELIPPPYNITVNNTPVEYNTILENETLSIIYFTYEHSKLEIIIVPEFPSIIILLLPIIFATFAIILTKRKTSRKTQINNSYSL